MQLTLARRLRSDTSGLALIEFAFALPILLAIGFGGMEVASLALANLRVSHAAIDLADNVSRMGHQSTSTGYQTLTEADVADAFQAMRQEKSDLTTNGRVTVSSVEARTDANGNQIQFLHWQRCVGMKTAPATNLSPAAPTDDSGKTVTGIGSPALTAPPNSALMFVEVNYSYTSLFQQLPILGSALAGPQSLHYVSAMIVRQSRSTNDAIDNSAQLTRMTCDKYTT